MTRILGLFTLLLVGCTWRLWFVVSEFPLVPWLPLPDAWAPLLLWLDRLAALLLVVALGGMVVVPANDGGPMPPRSRASRRCWTLALAAMVWLVFTNQHRLQPWAYHFLLSGYVILAFPRERALRWLLALLCSVYVFSAWNKVDYRFLATTGDWMVRTAAGWFHPAARSASPGAFARAAWILPAGETLLAAGLAFPGTRAAARWLALGMHGGLLLVLGPWGLAQRSGVLVWNLSFAVQAWYLATRTRPAAPAAARPDIGPESRSDGSVGKLPGRSAIWRRVPLVLALSLPALEPWGWWDHWPSWGLYSARAGRLELLISEEAAAQLPPSTRAYLDARTVDGIWRRLALDRWSLESLDAPLYPQTRFQWGICRAVVESLPGSSHPVMVWEQLPPARTTGRAERRSWGGDEAMQRGTLGFWFNTRPRPSPRPAR